MKKIIPFLAILILIPIVVVAKDKASIIKIPPSSLGLEQVKPQEPAPELPKSGELFLTDQITIKKKDGERLFFDVELAISSRQQAQGLMHRTEMDKDAGMLFVFDRESKRSFWMKNTLIPLDMLFISKDGTIHHIHHNARPQDLTSITSERDSLAVLEINGGMADKIGITEGDTIIYSTFKNEHLK